MVMRCAILLLWITIGTNAYAGGQDCKYVQITEYKGTEMVTSKQEYVCTTPPKEVINRTEYVPVQTCLGKLLFGADCTEYNPEGHQAGQVLSAIISMGIL